MLLKFQLCLAHLLLTPLSEVVVDIALLYTKAFDEELLWYVVIHWILRHKWYGAS